MIVYMDKVIGWLLVLSAIYTLYAVLTPDHAFVG